MRRNKKGNKPGGKSKLTIQDVRKIRWLDANTTVTTADIAEAAGVSTKTIRDIITGVTWVDD